MKLGKIQGHYISNEYEHEMISVTNKRGIEKIKPLPISKYNEHMSGMDRQDQLLNFYPSERKTIKWYKKLLVHILHMNLLNAFLLYSNYKIGGKVPFYIVDLKLFKASF